VGVAPTRPRLTFRRARIAVLLALLATTTAWAAGVELRRHARARWERPVEVGVVILDRDGAVDARQWRRGLEELAAHLHGERTRCGSPGFPPFRFTVVAPLRWERPLPLSPPTDGAADRAWHALELWRELRAVDAAAGTAGERWDVRVYVVAVRVPGWDGSFAEGVGAQNGELVIVRGSAQGDLSMPLQVIGHELLHTVGASDKYDEAGHALVPAGLADPDAVPRFPQRHAEWMAGEVALAPGAGRLPGSLTDLRVGPVTAREIGWTRAGPPPPALGVAAGRRAR
jgi:hypothetical protein